mmetsp:Transcript_6381/g.18672  ORF Transcript_6381/g.18672 Transcript_6381/m.18672 type:complete len:212 (-) Transcript_6381:319-954(-)
MAIRDADRAWLPPLAALPSTPPLPPPVAAAAEEADAVDPRLRTTRGEDDVPAALFPPEDAGLGRCSWLECLPRRCEWGMFAAAPSPPSKRKVLLNSCSGARATITLNRTKSLVCCCCCEDVGPAPVASSSPPPIPPPEAVSESAVSFPCEEDPSPPPPAPPPPGSRTAWQQNTVPPTLNVMGWPHRGGFGRKSFAMARGDSVKKSSHDGWW